MEGDRRGAHNNEGDLRKYIGWCRDRLHRESNSNWVDEDNREMFEEERDALDEQLDELEENYCGSGTLPTNPESSSTFYRLQDFATLRHQEDFSWGAWLDEDEDLTFKWEGDEADDPKIPIGYGGASLQASTLMQTSALLRHRYDPKNPPAPVTLKLESLDQGTKKIYIGHAPACEIDALSQVPNIDPGLTSSDFSTDVLVGRMGQDQWQRIVDVRRIRSIADFMEGNENFIFNPILLYVDINDDSVNLKKKPTKKDTSAIIEVDFSFLIKRKGTLYDYVPKPGQGDVRPMRITDGQHRVRGLAMSERGHQLPIPFVLIIGEDPIEDRKLIAKIFTEINTKSVPIDPLHRLYLSYKFGMTGIGPRADFEIDDEQTDNYLSAVPTTGSRPQRRAYELALFMASTPGSPLYDMIEFQRPTILGRRRDYKICVNAVNWVHYVRRWFIRDSIYSDWNSDSWHADEVLNFFKAFQEVCTLNWPDAPRWVPGRGRTKPLLQFEGPFLSLLEFFPRVVSTMVNEGLVNRPISKSSFVDELRPLRNVDWLSPRILQSALRGRTNTNIRHLVKWMRTAINNPPDIDGGESYPTVEEVLDPALKSEPGKGILATPDTVRLEFLSGERWPSSRPVSLRVMYPHHTLGSSWSVRWIDRDGNRTEWKIGDGSIAKSDADSELSISIENLPPSAEQITIEAELSNANGSSLTNQVTLPE